MWPNMTKMAKMAKNGYLGDGLIFLKIWQYGCQMNAIDLYNTIMETKN